MSVNWISALSCARFITDRTSLEPPEDYNQDICVMDADGDDVENLTETEGVFENYPAWGPEAE